MNKYTRLAIIFLGIVAVITQIISIYLSNKASLESIGATKLRAQISELSEANLMLQSELLSLSSYSAISSRAAELGYKNHSEFVSLGDPIEVARIR